MFAAIRTYYKNMVPQITEADWNAIEKKLTVQQYKKGETLVRNGEVCRYVSFLNYGLVRLFYLIDGKEIATGFIREYEYISEYNSFLTQTPAMQNIDALEDCEVVHLSFTDMQQLYKSNPVFEIFGRKMAEYLFILLSSHNTSLLALSPEQRYQQLIEQQSFIMQRVPQYMVASFIGVSPEHLSRIRKKISSNK